MPQNSVALLYGTPMFPYQKSVPPPPPEHGDSSIYTINTIPSSVPLKTPGFSLWNSYSSHNLIQRSINSSSSGKSHRSKDIRCRTG